MGRFDDMQKGWGKPADNPAKPSGSGDFELMPDGIYTCELYDIQERQPKKGGEAFSVTLAITEGDHAKRRVWDWINYNLPHSAQATDIGQETFRSLCVACGFVDGPPNELGDLFGQELQVRLGTRAASGGYPAKNCVRAYLPHGAQAGDGDGDDTSELF